MVLEQSDIVQTLYTQPPGSNMCGQYTVAHLLNIEPNESIKAFRASNPRENMKAGTQTKHVHRALNYLGWESPKFSKLLPPKGKLPKVCILNIRWIRPGTYEHGEGHWVLYNRGYVVCSGPDQAGVYELKKYLKDREGVVISYLEVKRRD